MHSPHPDPPDRIPKSWTWPDLIPRPAEVPPPTKPRILTTCLLGYTTQTSHHVSTLSRRARLKSTAPRFTLPLMMTNPPRHYRLPPRAAPLPATGRLVAAGGPSLSLPLPLSLPLDARCAAGRPGPRPPDAGEPLPLPGAAPRPRFDGPGPPRPLPRPGATVRCGALSSLPLPLPSLPLPDPLPSSSDPAAVEGPAPPGRRYPAGPAPRPRPAAGPPGPAGGPGLRCAFGGVVLVPACGRLRNGLLAPPPCSESDPDPLPGPSDPLSDPESPAGPRAPGRAPGLAPGPPGRRVAPPFAVSVPLGPAPPESAPRLIFRLKADRGLSFQVVSTVTLGLEPGLAPPGPFLPALPPPSSMSPPLPLPPPPSPFIIFTTRQHM